MDLTSAINQFRDDPMVFWASILTLLSLVVLLVPVTTYGHDSGPIEYGVEIPQELSPDCDWDLSEESISGNEPEVCVCIKCTAVLLIVARFEMEKSILAVQLMDVVCRSNLLFRSHRLR